MTMVLDMVSICFYSSFVLFSESHTCFSNLLLNLIFFLLAQDYRENLYILTYRRM